MVLDDLRAIGEPLMIGEHRVIVADPRMVRLYALLDRLAPVDIPVLTRGRDHEARIVATTHRDLEADVAAGRFYGDLFFHLSIATLDLPPLRHRLFELPLLASAFLEDACRHGGRSAMQISEGAMAVLRAYSWPGNIRELKNVMQYVAAALAVDVLLAVHLSEQLGRLRPSWTPTPRVAAAVPASGFSFRPIADELRELEITRIREALEATSGNQTRAAGLLAMPIRTFFAKAKQYGLTPRRKRDGDPG